MSVSRTIKSIFSSILFIGCLASLQIWNPLPVEALRMKMFDLYQKVAPASTPKDHTIIVDIDDRSLAVIGQWPWDRATFAKLVDSIAAGDPSVIGLDIVFPESDRLSPSAITQTLTRFDKEAGADAGRLLGSLPDTDQILADTLARAPVVAAIAAAPTNTPNPLPRLPISLIGEDPSPFLPAFSGAVASIPEVTASARGAGNITIEPGIDGVVRHIPMAVKAGDTLLPALSLEMLRVADNAKAMAIRTKPWGVTEIVFEHRTVPLDGAGRTWIHFAPHDERRFVSAVDLLAGEIDTSAFQGRRVIIGSSAFGLWDLRAIPLGYSMPGVEIQAQMLDGIHSGNILQRPYWLLGIEAVMTIVAGLALLVLLRRVGAKWTLTALLFLIGLLALVSVQFYARSGILLDAAYPSLATATLYLSLVHAGHTRSEAIREIITGAFKKYLSPVLVERLAKGAESLNLGGEVRELSILFADIKGFTPLAEKLKDQPQRLTKLTNLLLDRMSEAVLSNGGTIDKFMGDNVMAFWNAPLDDPLHPTRACRAAIDMQKALHTLNAEIAADPEWHDIAGIDIHFEAGIGINTGECVVGNFGSRHRFDYSVIGDSVNLASRLEGAAKRYDCAALISASTASRIDGFPLSPLGEITIRGRAEKVQAYLLKKN